MTSLLGEICHIFCCPPRPSHIVAKFAFLPPPPTYTIVQNASGSHRQIVFKPEAGHLSDEAKEKMEVFYTITKRNSRIACLYIRYDPPTYGRHFHHCRDPSAHNSKNKREKSSKLPIFTVLFSHGNAVDIGQMAAFLQSLSQCFRVNILVYDYSGYGASSGQTLEDNLYADAEAALSELRARYLCPLDRIVLYGQSIGTAPTVELATRHKVAGVILHSGLLSGLRVVCPGTTRRFCFDPFTNIDKVSKIHSPTLIMHGTEDEVVGIHHGRELYARLVHPLEPLWIDGAGHNDIELFPEYTSRLEKFFTEDLLFDQVINRPNATPVYGDRFGNTSISFGTKDRSKSLLEDCGTQSMNTISSVPSSDYSSNESFHSSGRDRQPIDETQALSTPEKFSRKKSDSNENRTHALHLSLIKKQSKSEEPSDSSSNKKWSSMSFPLTSPDSKNSRPSSWKKKNMSTATPMSPVPPEESLI